MRKDEKMAEKNGPLDKEHEEGGDPVNDEEMEDEECEEDMIALNAQLDALSSALDSLEQKNDFINDQLRQILEENKQAREEVKEQ
ncbi:bublin coiled-coil protein [Oratosquilla oratoria]|uniref:bublin coiled-coil protein n=1 Tax=Oratosquilla oratoria TaxID=337810 RepID=UPI003F75E64D